MEWRPHHRYTDLEEWFAALLHAKIERAETKGVPLVVTIRGSEFGRRKYLHILACDMMNVPMTHLTVKDLSNFLRTHREFTRRRITLGGPMFYEITGFIKAWQERRTRSKRIGKTTNPS